jgi:hypothetical protein
LPSLEADNKVNAEFIVKLIGAFREFSVYDLADKSVNGHTCRKSSLLSQMLINHKMLSKQD